MTAPVTPESTTPDPGDDVAEAPPRRRTGLIVSAVVAVLAIGFVAVLARSDPATDRRRESPLVGKVVPPLAGETLDGGNFDIDGQQGRWVVVNFFATWCVPCRIEHPELDAFDREHRRAGDAVLVSVLFDDDTASARTFFERNGGDWPVVLDGDGLIASAFGTPKVPESYLVTPGGRVAAKFTGGVTREGLDRAIDQIEQAAADRGAP